MKLKLIRIVLTFSLTTFLLVGYEQLHAQDSNTSEPYESNDEKEKEPLYSPGEQSDRHLRIQPSTPLRDSAAFAPKTTSASQAARTAKTSAESAKPDTKQSTSDDSILSFNFLYYIIQKYKLQDIVD